MKRRIVCVLLVLLLAVGIGFAMPMAAETDTEAEVTRSQWLQKLVATFEMTVEDGVYPDNYFSDLSSSSQYYYDMLLAVEFGVVDIPAGGELRPDDPATREFAAQTLNFCLGFQLGEDAEYTYPEAEDVTYPDDIQVSIDRGWFSLTEEGAFLPEQPVTSAEADVMIADAEEILAATGLDENFTNVYEFAEGVVEVPGWANVTKSGENEITITDCPVELEQGQQFAVYFGGIPSVYTAEAIEETENSLVISTVKVEETEAFEQLEAQGVIAFDPRGLEPDDSIQIAYIDPETGMEYEDISTLPAPMSETELPMGVVLREKNTFTIQEGLTVQVDAEVSNIMLKYNFSKQNGAAEVIIDADVKFSYAVTGDAAEGMKVDKIEFDLLDVPFLYVGHVKLGIETELSGSMSGEISGHVTTGLANTPSGQRLIKDFHSETFSVVVKVTGKIGAVFKIGVTDLPVLNVYLYAKIGMEGFVKATIHGDDQQPAICESYQAHLYVSAGVYGSLNFFEIYEKEIDLAAELFNENTSPIRIAHHREDGKTVRFCSRGSSYQYYTPTESPYWECGVDPSNASSVAYNKNGQAVTLWQYTLDDAGNATITRYFGSNTHVVIPSSIDGHTVTGVSRYTSGDYSMFGYRNSKVQSVIIPDSVTTIGEYAFYYCSALQTVDIPDSVISVGDYAFQYCTALQSASFGENSVTIGYRAFRYCTALQSVSLGEGTATVGEYAFDGCTSMTKLEINGSIVPGTNAFQNCTALEEVYIANIKAWCATNFDNTYANPLYYGAALYVNGEPVGDLVVPDGVTQIGNHAFRNCSNLTSVTIPDSVTTIGALAFNGCKAMETVELPEEPIHLGDSAFGNSGITAVHLPVGTRLSQSSRSYHFNGYGTERTVGYSPFDGCENLREVTFEEGWVSIPAGLFENCTGLEEISIPETVTTIGVSAFEGCTNLHTVHIPDSVLSIDINAFADCTALKNVTMSEDLETLGGYAFYNCTALECIAIPKSLRSAGYSNQVGPFAGCSALEQVIFEEGITSICGSLFAESGLKEITIPDSVTTIGAYAFDGCKELTAVQMGDNVISIGEYAFSDCIALNEIQTAASVGNRAFQNCTALTTATVDGGSVGSYAFQNCTDLEQVVLGSGVTSIGTYCFYNCISLTDVQLSSGMTYIPSYAFSQCAKLRKITIPRGVTSIGSYAFHACPLLTEITIPREVTSIDATAFSYPARMYIYGVAGTYAQTYADTYEAAFIDRQTLAQSASLNKDTLFINRGLTEQLILTAEPMEHTDAVTWKSSNTNVVTVDQKGNVKAVNLGTATIKVTVGDDISASCKVTVTQPVTSIGLNISAITLEALDTYQLVASISPSNAFDKSVTWESSDEKIASVDENGLVTAHSKGTATITVRTKDGSNLYRSCTINVTNTAYVVDNLSKFQSLHSYPNNCSDNWILTLPGQESIPVTFDERTNIEEDFDYLYIYDGQDKLIGTYTGTTLAGQTVTVPGDTVKIRLISDESGRTWGFKVIDVGVQLCEHETLNDVSEPNGDRTHTNRTLCANCEKVFSRSVADCADEDGDYTCDICAGDLTCRHGDGEIFYECLEDGEHLMSVVCTICRETVYTDERVCDDRNADGICDQCQTTISVEPEIEKFSVAGSNMTLGNELVVNVMFMKNKVSGSDNTIEVVHGDAVTVLKQENWESYNAAMYVVRIPVAAKEMADALTVTIKNADGLEISNAYSTSVRDYAMKVLAGNLSTYNQNMKNLAVDMLNYGAAAQMSFSYNTDDMANSLLTDEYKQWASADVVCDNEQVKGTNCAGSNLSLESKILLNIVFRLTDADKTGKYAVVSYTDYTGKEISYRVENADFGRLNAAMQGVVVDEIVLADAFSLVTVTIFNADGTVYGTGSDSVESYAARVESDLNKAIMKFALSAKTYLSK